MRKLKINDEVKYNKFPYENDIFLIVGDKDNSWFKASPYFPKGEEVVLEANKEFILLKKQKKTFGIFGIIENGLHVRESEIELL